MKLEHRRGDEVQLRPSRYLSLRTRLKQRMFLVAGYPARLYMSLEGNRQRSYSKVSA